MAIKSCACSLLWSLRAFRHRITCVSQLRLLIVLSLGSGVAGLQLAGSAKYSGESLMLATIARRVSCRRCQSSSDASAKPRPWAGASQAIFSC